MQFYLLQVLEKFMSTVPENTNYQQQVFSTHFCEKLSWRGDAGAVNVPLLLGLRGDHQRLPGSGCVRVCKRRVWCWTGGTRRYLNVSIDYQCNSIALQKYWVSYGQRWIWCWVVFNWNHVMSLNAQVDASCRWAIPQILVKRDWGHYYLAPFWSSHLHSRGASAHKCFSGCNFYSWGGGGNLQAPLFNQIHVRLEIHLAEWPFLLVMLNTRVYLTFISDIRLYVL